MKLLYRQRAYPFRSRGLFRFLRILASAYPEWVDLAGIERRLPGIDPRQLARFVDLLEASDLPLVRYETKTRGRFRLAVEPGTMIFPDEPDRSPARMRRAAPDAPMATGLAAYRDPAWVAWVVGHTYAVVAIHGGNLSGKNGALGHLDDAEAATRALPPWTASVVHACRAFVLERESRYREAAFWLRRIDTAARCGHAHPAAPTRAQLIRAKIRYDQGRYAEAERLLGAPNSTASHDPYWLNMNALATGRKFLGAAAADAPALLTQTLSLLAQALGHVFLWYGDTSLLNALCYNFGNNLFRGIKRGLVPASCADVVMQWLAANMLVCRKLGFGEDSILANLLLIDIGLDYGFSVERWPPQLRHGLSLSGDLADLLATTLAQARKTGNRLEVAQSLRRQVRTATEIDRAKAAYIEAVGLFGELGRKDIAAQVAEEWRARYEVPPPTFAGGGG